MLTGLFGSKDRKYQELSEKKKGEYLSLLERIFGNDFSPHMENFFKAWMKALGQDFHIRQENFTPAYINLSSKIAKNLTPQEDWESRRPGDAINFTTRDGNTITVTNNAVSFRGDKAQANDLFKMAFLASRDEDMMNDGLELQGTPYEKAILQLSIDHINQTRGGRPIQIQNRIAPEELAATAGAQQNFNAYIRDMGLEPPPAPAPLRTAGTSDRFESTLKNFTIPPLNSPKWSGNFSESDFTFSRPAKTSWWQKPIKLDFTNVAIATTLSATLAISTGLTLNHHFPNFWNDGDSSSLNNTTALTPPPRTSVKATPKPTAKEVATTQKMFLSAINPLDSRGQRRNDVHIEKTHGPRKSLIGVTLSADKKKKTPVRAKADGKVVHSAIISGGRDITIRHALKGGGYVDAYYRGVISPKVKEGDIVNKGFEFAQVGPTGKIYVELTNKHGNKIDPFGEGLEIVTNKALEAQRDAIAKAKATKAFDTHPIAEGHNSRPSSGFGMRRHPITKRQRHHDGQDYAAKKGTPIVATECGTVKHTARKGGYGKTVMIDHSSHGLKGYETLFGHMNKYAKGLKVGKKVCGGDVIGYVGTTGSSTGNHLHYEFRINGVPKSAEQAIKTASSILSKKYQLAAKAAASKPATTKVASGKALCEPSQVIKDINTMDIYAHRRPLIKLADDIAEEVGIDKGCFRNQIGRETSFRKNFVGKAGEIGLGQIHPNKLEDLDLTPKQAKIPEVGLRYSANIMKGYLDDYNGDMVLALAAYNGGEGVVKDVKKQISSNKITGTQLITALNNNLKNPEHEKYKRSKNVLNYIASITGQPTMGTTFAALRLPAPAPAG